MALPYADVIGDPIGHSKSPLIHRFWLEKLGLDGDYRAARVQPRDLAAYLQSRRGDRHWRGCNVTAPLKQQAAGLVGTPAGLCDFVGAVNCITRTPLGCLIGTNTDMAGIDEALKDFPLREMEVALIGAGGAARAALCYLVRRGAHQVTIIARDKDKGQQLATMVQSGTASACGMDVASAVIARCELVINATPMGMTDGSIMVSDVLDGLHGQAAFDMVYAPAETPFLAAARERGGKAVDGLTMLIGQAAPSFELFFGASAPREHDAELRALLTA